MIFNWVILLEKLLTNEDCAYIAGFLDGDGSIFVSCHPNRFKLRVAFASTDKNVIIFIRDTLILVGESKAVMRRRTKFSKPSTRDEYLLDYCGDAAKKISKCLVAFLVVKKKNAIVARNFPVSDQNYTLPKEDKELQEMLHLKMKMLNQNSHNIIIVCNDKTLVAEELAWLAGFFDAEGCVSIIKFKRKNGVGYRLKVSVSNTNRSVLEYIISKFASGGKIADHKDLRGNRKENHEFYIYGNSAKDFLKFILPYLIVKKEQAVYALAFPISERGSAGRTRLETIGQKMLHTKMAVLNRTGVN